MPNCQLTKVKKNINKKKFYLPTSAALTLSTKRVTPTHMGVLECYKISYNIF
jgi:hypothetical protein